MDVVLGQFTHVLSPFMVEEVSCIGLLEQCVPNILLILQHLLHHAVVPNVAALGGLDAVRR